MKSKLMRFATITVYLVVTAVFLNVYGQKSKIVEGGIIGGIPYASTDFENINLANGGLNLNFPLASLNGRGGAGFSYSLWYNSKLWQTVTNPVYDSSYQPNPTYQNFLAESTDGGWHDNGEFELNIWDRTSGMDMPAGNPCEAGVQWVLAYKWKVDITFPDGRRIEFRPTGHSDRPPSGLTGAGGYFNVYPNGSVTSVHGTTSQCYIDSTPPTTTRTTYYSSDGSGIRLTFANSEPLGFVWEMSMPDGSRVQQLSDRQKVIDKNGNYVESGTVTLPDGIQLPGWKDQVGRYIARQKNYVAKEDHYYQLGYNGKLLTWTVKWKDVYVRKNYVTTCNTCGARERGPVINTQLVAMMRVVESIEMPKADENAQARVYRFDYHAKGINNSQLSSGWGEVKSVEIPTGAKVSYGYKLSSLPSDAAYDELFPGETYLRVDQILERAGTITAKRLNYTELYDGQGADRQDAWQYSFSHGGSRITGPDGGVSEQYFWDIINDEKKGGQVYKEVKPNGTVIERVWANNYPVGFDYGLGNHLNGFVKTEFVTIPDASGSPSLTAIKDYNYDRNGNLLSVSEYDWIPANSSTILRDDYGIVTGFTGLTPVRITSTSYYNAAPAYFDQTSSANAYYLSSAPALRNLVASSEVWAGGETGPSSRTEITYDAAASPTLGNPTEVRTWDSSKSSSYSPLTTTNSISIKTQYDQYGNPILITDANLNQTQITYGPVSSYTGLYPTQTITAFGTSVARTSTATYDFYTGSVTTATDVDNGVSTKAEYDDFGRPTKVRTAADTSLESWVRTEYDDDARRVITRSDVNSIGDGRKVLIQHYDQLGRVRLSRTLEDVVTQDPTNENDGIKVQTRHLTSNPYTYQLTSNPYRAATSSLATNEPSMGWTLSKAQNAGRQTEVETFSGAALPAPWGDNASTTGTVKTNIDADATTVTDQTGKMRRSITNALGWLVRVDEPTSAGLGAVSSPNQPTVYGYDVLNNLLTVRQTGSGTEQCGPAGGTCTQTRSFAYSSLSRLLSATNPESGTIQYQYDSNGNLKKKTDARGVVTDYVYDQLNRVKQRNYSTPNGTPGTGILANYQVTPNVTYIYGIATPAVGKLVKVESRASTTEYLSFDALGRVTRSQQTTEGGDPAGYTTVYAYNLGGALVEEGYPSGRVVRNVIDQNGDLSMVQSKKGPAAGFWNYAQNFTYSASGAVTSMQLGNGRWESTVLNSRLQTKQIALGNVQNGTDLLKLDYEYGAANNNGNILSQTITAPATVKNGTTYAGFTAVQNYSYDSLNRIQQAYEMPQGWTEASCTNDPTKCWMQTFSFDRYGNRNFDELATTTLPKECDGAVCEAVKKIYDPAIDSSKNRLSTNDGYSYDNAGNTIGNAENRAFIYDSENRQVEVRNASIVPPSSDSDANLIGRYWYDGDGRRVKKFVPSTGETTFFVYDASGKVIAEFSTNETPQGASVSYLTNDRLGSPRITTDASGKEISRRDFRPFGEEIRRESYGSDNVRQRYTGYERDSETHLDFAQARYFDYSLGRYSTPDKIGNDSWVVAPQSWNLYSYARNNPLVFKDGGGRKIEIIINDRTYSVGGSREEGFYLIGNDGKNALVNQVERFVKTLGGTTLGGTLQNMVTTPATSVFWVTSGGNPGASPSDVTSEPGNPEQGGDNRRDTSSRVELGDSSSEIDNQVLFDTEILVANALSANGNYFTASSQDGENNPEHHVRSQNTVDGSSVTSYRDFYQQMRNNVLAALGLPTEARYVYFVPPVGTTEPDAWLRSYINARDQWDRNQESYEKAKDDFMKRQGEEMFGCKIRGGCSGLEDYY